MQQIQTLKQGFPRGYARLFTWNIFQPNAVSVPTRAAMLHLRSTRSHWILVGLGIGQALGPHLFAHPIFNHARILVGSLAHLAAVQMLEPRAQGTVDIVILAREAILSTISQRIELISPVTVKVEPLRRCQRAGCGGAQRVVRMIIRIHVRIQEGIP